MGRFDSAAIEQRGVSKLFCILGLSCALALSACGGGGDSGPTPGSNDSLPPNPGDAGKETIAGIDSDGDGVRDDIEIALSTQNLSNDEKSASLQVVKGVQGAIQAGIAGTSVDSQREAAIALAMAVDCMSYRFGSDATDQIALIELFATNTPARAAAYEEFNAATVGQQFGAMESEGVACE